MKFYDNASAPFSATRALASLAAAVDQHLNARGDLKLHAWRHLETKLAEVNELLKFVA